MYFLACQPAEIENRIQWRCVPLAECAAADCPIKKTVQTNSSDNRLGYPNCYYFSAFLNMIISHTYMHVFGSISIPMIGSVCENSTTGK